MDLSATATNIIGWCDMEDDFLEEFYVCRAEFENDTWLWNDEYPNVQEAEMQKRILMEELEDFDIPY